MLNTRRAFWYALVILAAAAALFPRDLLTGLLGVAFSLNVNDNLSTLI